MRTKRTFENWKRAVINESKRYPSLRRLNGQFNQSYLKLGFESGQSARAFCNSMTEIT